MKLHHYKTKVEWTGNQGKGTANYKAYSREHRISVENKTRQIHASADPEFLGDPSKYNPEELFLSAISACHMLWYLHLCAVNKIVVVEYIDEARGTMALEKDGSGHFTTVSLHPTVTIEKEGNTDKAIALHHQANKMCFIANSCNFDIKHFPNIIVNEKP